jgi:hypothetical protein
MVELFMYSECLGHAVEVLVAVFRAGEAFADRHWSFVCGHPQLEVSIMQYRHESGKRWSPEDSVILRGPINDLKLDLLLPEI